MTDTQPIGLIGIGLLGSALAERLLAEGSKVVGFDTNTNQRAALTDLGGTAVDEVAKVVRNCPILFLSLPNSATVSALIDQLESEFQPGQIVIDTTTGDPTQMVSIGETLGRWGVHYIEALVAGSSAQVRAGQVVLFVGGEDEAVTKVTPVLAAITETHFHLGAVGAASRFKLVHNLILGLNRAVLAEGLTFAESLGIDPGEALRILPQTPAASAVMETKGQRMVAGDFAPQARLSQHLKDVKLILEEARRTGCNTPLSQLHQTLLEQAEDLGFGDADNGAIIEAFRSPQRKKANS
jgi:3-hydroxyisobutyrate dehydrogenase-like beta-hydroxyacid dehydrogenase